MTNKKTQIKKEDLELFDKQIDTTLTNIAVNGLCLGILANNKNTLNVKSYEIFEGFKCFTPPPDFEKDLRPAFTNILRKGALHNAFVELEILFIFLYSFLLKVKNKKITKNHIANFTKKTFPLKVHHINKILEGRIARYEKLWLGITHINTALLNHDKVVEKGKTITIRIPEVAIILHNEKGAVPQPIYQRNFIDLHKTESVELIFKESKKVFTEGQRITFTDAEIAFLLRDICSAILTLQTIVKGFCFDKGIDAPLLKQNFEMAKILQANHKITF